MSAITLPLATSPTVNGARPHRLQIHVVGLAECECGRYSIEYPSPVSYDIARAIVWGHNNHVNGTSHAHPS